ncbi:hypothetical protein BVG16_20145 [Paenibacillus selenitireducens]|uniref:Uncharacterized protein n=1 Tax=Paenibacillus selenitireducens TaxID=1324314 RepID=A0A1T2X700_9BACL|nr:hypothetical protein [Paenibacillus selenitireducens]OPA75650.1 hypothetical protein BVG16_20145 [Paenibacillus selenitireducens]
MYKDTQVYLFLGYGSEYVLNPLYNYMVKLGYECVEVDMMKHPSTISTLQSLIGRKVVLITSAHLFFDKMNFKNIHFDAHGSNVHILAVLEGLNPIRKVYYPHDLIEPLNPPEFPWLPLFDVFLSPLPHLKHYERYTKVVEVGWIKKLEPTPPIIKGRLNIVHLLSEFIVYNRIGFESTFQYWCAIWNQGVSVKLPKWPGYKEFEIELINKGINVYSAEKNIFEIINENDVIITNSSSSVNTEASLSGRLTLNMMDGMIPTYMIKNTLQGLPGLHILSMSEGAHYISELRAGKRQPLINDEVLKPFDFDLAVQALTD